MVQRARARIDTPLELHFHNDFGHSVVSTIAGLAAGASVAHVTMSGIGERAGNTPLEETVLSLLTRASMLGACDAIEMPYFGRLILNCKSLNLKGFRLA